MVAIRTRFDGEKIEVPAELRGAAPGEVIVIFTPRVDAGDHSIWDVVGKSSVPRTAADLDREIAEERDAWNDR
jgi:hypothetical protein